MKLEEWAAAWVETRHDLRPTTWARLRVSMDRQVLPRFGSTALAAISNADVRSWVAEMIAGGLSAATVRKAVFALRQCLSAAVADRRLMLNAASDVPLPSESSASPRLCRRPSLSAWLRDAGPYRALVLVGAYAGLRWGEAVGLTRRNMDVLRSRIIVETTAVEVTARSRSAKSRRRSGPSGRIPSRALVMRRIEQHLAATTSTLGVRTRWSSPGTGGPLFRSTSGGRSCSRPSPRGTGRIHLPRSAAQLRRDPGGRWLQRPGGLGVGRSQQRGLHPDPLRRPVRGRPDEAVDRLDALLGDPRRLHGSSRARRALG